MFHFPKVENIANNSSSTYSARLAQSVEHETLNLRVVGSSPTLGDSNSFKILYGVLFMLQRACYDINQISFQTKLHY